MTNSQSELSTKLERILHIYILAQDAYLYTEYFHNPETEEERTVIYSSAHSSNLKMIMHLMFRGLITEVAKLFKNTAQEKFSINAFVQSLSPSGHFRKFGISAEFIAKWNDQLKENQETIAKVLLLRDKVYAHTDDPLKSYSDTDLTFKNIKSLLDLAAEILKEIYRVVLDTDLLLRSPTFDRERFGMLKLLAKAEKQRVEDIYKKYFPNRK